MSKEYEVPHKEYLQVLKWLDKNVQENCYPNLQKFNSSAISQFIEWRSKDHKTWTLRISGSVPKCHVTINHKKLETMFVLRWC